MAATLWNQPGLCPPVQMPAFRAGELRRVVQAAVRVFRDSEQTGEIQLAEQIVARTQLRTLLDGPQGQTPEARALLLERPELMEVDLDALRALPPGTLGREWMDFLDSRGFSIRLAALTPIDRVDDPEVEYLLRRLWTVHDLIHVLLGLGTRGHEEILVHAFSLARTGLASSVVLLVFGGLKHIVLEARWRCLTRGLRAAWETGVAAGPVIFARWEDHFATPLEDVREAYGLPRGGIAAATWA